MVVFISSVTLYLICLHSYLVSVVVLSLSSLSSSLQDFYFSFASFSSLRRFLSSLPSELHHSCVAIVCHPHPLSFRLSISRALLFIPCLTSYHLCLHSYIISTLSSSLCHHCPLLFNFFFLFHFCS